MNELWLRLSRTDAVNWIVITVVSVLQLVGSFVFNNSIPSGKQLLFIGCVAISILVIIALLLATRYFLVPFVPVTFRPFIVLVAFQVTAFVRSFVFDGLLVSLQLSTSDLFFSRLYGSQFNIFVGGLVAAGLVSMARDFSESNEKLFLTLADLNTDQINTQTRLKKRGVALISSIRDQLETALSSLTGTNAGSDAQQLQSLIDDVVRPISYRLGREFENSSNDPAPHTPIVIRWSTVITHALKSNPIHPLWLTVWTAFITGQIIAKESPTNFFLPFAFALFCFAVWYSMSRYAWEYVHGFLGITTRALIFSLLILCTPAVVNFPLQRIFDLDFFNAQVVLSAAIYFLIMAWCLALVISLTSLLKEINFELLSATNQLRRHLITQNVNARHFEQAVSQVLHGPIQDAIAASLRRIQSLPRDVDSSKSEAEIIRQHVEGALTMLVESPTRTFSVERAVHDIAELWSGVVTIALRCSPDTSQQLQNAQSASSIVIEVIREAISNAIRHGDATWIDIEIDVCEADGDVQITVMNNGASLSNDTTTGMGSALLNNMTMQWSRFNREDRVVLTAVVPVARSERLELPTF